MANRCAWTLACAALLASPARAVTPEADKKILEGLDAAYGMDFERSASLFQEADKLDPQSPAAPFFLASLLWLEFSQNADLPGTIDALEPRFDATMDQAFDRARALYEQNHDDPEANFYLGAAYGMKGRWRLLKRQWIRAAADGYKGYKYLKRTIELEPNYYDAYLGLGMYDYYAEELPSVMKFAASLIAHGDKERGLRYIFLTRDKGHYSVTEAKLFLVAVYAAYEKEPLKGLEIVLGLRKEKPDNLFFTFMEVATRIDAQDWVGAQAFGEYLAPRVREVPYTKPHVSLFDLYLGEAYLGGKQYEKAIEALTRCVEQAPEPRKATVTFCFLRRAQAEDLLNRREDAVQDYKSVRSRADFFDSTRKAKKGLRRAVDYDEVLAQLLE